MKDPERKSSLNDPRVARAILVAVCLICGLLVAVDLVYHKHEIHFEFEELFGFYSFFGFVACVALVLLARLMRWVVRREEDYYDSM